MRSHPNPSLDLDRVASEGDDADDIRYSLTALGEALVTERAGRRFRGFGPCPVAELGVSRRGRASAATLTHPLRT